MKVDRPFGIAVATAAVVVVIGLMLWFGTNPDPVRADTSVPGAPSNLVRWYSWFPSLSGEGITLSWTAPEGTVTGYQILRQRSGCDTALQVYVEGTGSVATTYIDSDVVEGMTYVYRVKATNSHGVGPESNSATLQYRANPVGVYGAPGQPSNLEVRGTISGIQLSWEGPETLNFDATGYRILRWVPPGGNCERMPVHVENTGSTDTHWLDTDVEDETYYEYSVVAINDAGASRPSSPVRTGGQIRVRGTGIIMASLNGWLFPGTTRSFSIGVSHLDWDDDPDTVDYTLRGDVTDADGLDVDDCEPDGLVEVHPSLLEFDHRPFRLGEDFQINVVDQRLGAFHSKYGGGRNAERWEPTHLPS